MINVGFSSFSANISYVWLLNLEICHFYKGKIGNSNNDNNNNENDFWFRFWWHFPVKNEYGPRTNSIVPEYSQPNIFIKRHCLWMFMFIITWYLHWIIKEYSLGATFPLWFGYNFFISLAFWPSLAIAVWNEIAWCMLLFMLIGIFLASIQVHQYWQRALFAENWIMGIKILILEWRNENYSFTVAR